MYERMVMPVKMMEVGKALFIRTVSFMLFVKPSDPAEAANLHRGILGMYYSMHKAATLNEHDLNYVEEQQKTRNVFNDALTEAQCKAIADKITSSINETTKERDMRIHATFS